MRLPPRSIYWLPVALVLSGLMSIAFAGYCQLFGDPRDVFVYVPMGCFKIHIAGKLVQEMI